MGRYQSEAEIGRYGEESQEGDDCSIFSETGRAQVAGDDGDAPKTKQRGYGFTGDLDQGVMGEFFNQTHFLVFLEGILYNMLISVYIFGLF